MYKTVPNTSGFNLEEASTTNNEDELATISELLNKPPELANILNVETQNDGSSIITSCANCAEDYQFDSNDDVVPGTHILFGKYVPIDNANKAVSDVVKTLSNWLSFDRKFLYYHHAIVSEVVNTTDCSAKLKLIEFTSFGSMPFEVRETEKEIDLTDEDIFYKKYKNPRYNAEDIVKRAKSLVGLRHYELLAHNCENIAVWCITDEHESFQVSSIVDDGIRHTFSWIISIFGQIAKYIRFEVSFASAAILAIPGMAIAGVIFFIELVLSALKIKQLKMQKQRRFICTSCFNEKRIHMICKIFFAFFAIIILAATSVSSNILITICSIAVGILAIYILPRRCTSLYRKVKALLNPLYAVPKMVVKTAQHIRPGDKITIPDHNDILIRQVKRVGSSTRFVDLDIVHFQYRGFMGTRTVFKERFHFKLGRDLLQVLDVPADKAFPDDEVVANALDKANRREQGFHAMSYRSSHMAKQCKIRDYETSNRRVLLTTRDVETESDVKAGDMVNFRYLALPHVGIVVEKLINDIVELEFFHEVDGIIQLKTEQFDLGSCKIKKLNYPTKDVDTTMENA